MNDKEFIFLVGMHRSGTSLLHEILREHPSISGFSRTGVPEDEGQHLQSVYAPAKAFGGPGKFALDDRSYMDENHPLATPENTAKILEQWSPRIDPDCQSMIEKSPPNIIRTRFFQHLFPNSRFIAILRHPLAVAFATQKWSRTSIKSLLDNTFRAYDALLEDMKHLDGIYILRYEEFVARPQETVDEIFAFLGRDTVQVKHEIRTNINGKYFGMWENYRNNPLKRLFRRIPSDYEGRAEKYGYSIEHVRRLVPVPWLGAHIKNAT